MHLCPRGAIAPPLAKQAQHAANEIRLAPAVGLRQDFAQMPPRGCHPDVDALGIFLEGCSPNERFRHTCLGGRKIVGLLQEGLGHQEWSIREADRGRDPGLDPDSQRGFARQPASLREERRQGELNLRSVNGSRKDRTVRCS